MIKKKKNKQTKVNDYSYNIRCFASRKSTNTNLTQVEYSRTSWVSLWLCDNFPLQKQSYRKEISIN